ncbi:MAG: hypothetical protein QGI05_02860, partial [Candidatus Omnitrophota bacterium]|nr:hypothetical protein [Candidatus Omnitrophota bacterium]
RAIFYKKKGKLKVDFEERDGNYETGTLVQVRSAKLQGRREEVNEYLRRAYEDSDQVMVFLNGELINARTNITEINGHDIDFMVKDRVISINTYDDGFEIRDEGVGMDRATVLTKLPIPRRGTNQETHRRLQDDPKAGARSLLIQDELTDEEHPTMRAVFIVGSRAMDAFEVPSEGAILPRKIRIKFPAFTTLTDAKDSIVMDDVVKTTVDYLIGRLSEATPKNIFPIINGLSHIVRYLQDKDSAGEYNFIDSFVQKITTQVLIPYIEEHNAIFLPSREGLRNLSLDTNREVVYLDEMFFSDDTELLDRCLEDLPFVAGVTGGKAYSLPLAQGEEPVFIYGSTLFIDEKLRAELQDPAVPQEAKALLGAFLDAAQIRGYVVVPEGEDGQNRFTAILGQVSSFQELPGSIQTRILNRLNDTGMEEDVLASLVEAVQDTPAEDAASEVEGALEQETSRISSHTSDLLNLVERLSGSLWAQKGEQVASGIVEGRSCVVMKGEDFK